MRHPAAGESCCHEEGGRRPWYRSLTWIAAAATALLFAVAILVPALERLEAAFLEYFRLIFWPILAGFVLGGLVDYYVPKEYISKYLDRKGRSTVVYAAGLGLVMSACSHGILALSMELHKKGASGPAVVSFLLASPWANLPVTILLVGFFGWKGMVIIAAALGVSMLTGFVLQGLESRGWIERNRHAVAVSPDFSIRRDVQSRLAGYRFSRAQLELAAKGVWRGMKGLADMVLGWILIGITLASLASAFVPSSLFRSLLGPSLTGLLLTMALATVLEVCSEGTSPLAFEIYRQTGAFGNAFAFLMGGVITDYTEIGLLWTNLGRRTALWTVGLALPQVILLGWIFNRLF